MALNFPNTGLYPGYQYTGDNGVIYIYDGVKWVGHAPNTTPGTNSITNGSNTVQVDGSGNLVTPAYTFPGTVGTDGQVLTWPSSGTVLEWHNQQGGGGGNGYTGSQGSSGTNGYVGSQGSSGTNGYTGSQGDIGYTGSQGDIGYVGSQGDIGYVGSQGDLGYTGSAGADGYQQAPWQLTSSTSLVSLAANGTLTLPNSTTISDKLVAQYTSSFTAHDNASNGGLNGWFTSDVGAHPGFANPLVDTITIGWWVSGPGLHGVKQITNIAGEGGAYDYALTVDLTDGSTWAGGTYTFYSADYALVSQGTNLSVTTATTWIFGTDGSLALPSLYQGTTSTIKGDSIALQVAPGPTWLFDYTGTTFGNGAKLDGGTNYKFATDNQVVTSLDLRDTSGAGFYTDGGGITLRSNGTYNWVFDTAGNTYLPTTGYVQQGNAIRTQGTVTTSVLGSSSTVVFSAPTWMTAIKLIIAVEGRLDGDGTSTDHTQTAEATIAMTYNTLAEPVMSVYGLIYTTATPLATFAVRRTGFNGSGNVEVLATNSQTGEALTVRVLATQFVSAYD